MRRLTRDGTAEPVLREQILRREQGQEIFHFPCSPDHEQDWQPYPVDPSVAICDGHTYIHQSMCDSLFPHPPLLQWTCAILKDSEVVNAISTQMHDLIKSGLTRW